ncbi:MAG: hypothetical protein N5P05_000610 [Chroococcopsis gigantea SAG 12.99]|jgi:V8-like Glu-specific endopeptidase|nr:hypothetical protein [Chroococcopsis gigantea SAG 12.99]
MRTVIKILRFAILGLLLSSLFTFKVAAGSNPYSMLNKVSNTHQITGVRSIEAIGTNPEKAPSIPRSLARNNNPTQGSRAIIGEDKRVPMTSNAYPWSAVGRIVGLSADGEGYQCTGALIDENIVLTNSHCVINPKTHLLSKVVAFEPNLINGKLQDENDRAFVTKAYYGTDFRADKFPEPDDWAVLELDRPLGKKYGTIGWNIVPTSVLVQNPGIFSLIGYSGDFPKNNPGETASVNTGCSIVGEVDDVLTHNCDSMPGSSGGPILGIVDDQVRIVALNSAYTQNPNNQEAVNFAVKIARIVEDPKK